MISISLKEAKPAIISEGDDRDGISKGYVAKHTASA
jgi:hypothetical protein